MLSREETYMLAFEVVIGAIIAHSFVALRVAV